MQRDSYRSTGCFDLTCSGFVQTGHVVLGGTIGPISARWGPQYDINVGLFLVKKNVEKWHAIIYYYLKFESKKLTWYV